MELLDIARWQFGIVTVYHFVMVPLTIGLSILVAAMQTAWYRTGKQRYRKMMLFWGKLMMINFAMGVVTGIVQEFQFGMAWNAYSRFVGDVFGAPLAMEGLMAFFVESVFLGLWIFGAGRLSRGVHLACIWAFSLATVLSAFFILAANSWMQHPVGVEMVDGRPRLSSIGAVLGNSTLWAAWPHTIFGCFAVAGSFLIGISAWQLWRHHRKSDREEENYRAWHGSMRLGAWVGLIAFIGLAISGDFQGKLMFQQQPMKMASAEALCHSEAPASFSIFAVGDVSQPNCEDVKSFTVPYVLSYLAEGDFSSEVEGVQSLVPQYQERFGTHYPDDPRLGELAGQPIDYVPNLPVTYWGFRLMIGFGGLAALGAVLVLVLTRKRRFPRHGIWTLGAVLSIALPFLGNIAGWVFTEMGRQPWVVAPNPDPSGVEGVWLHTAQAVSGNLAAGEVLTSLITLGTVYGVLLVVELFLIVRVVRGGITEEESSGSDGDDEEQSLTFAY